MNTIRDRKPQPRPVAVESQGKLLSEKLTASYLGISPASLRKARAEGQRGGRTLMPPYVRLGGRVFYRRTDLDRWLSELPAYANLAEEGAASKVRYDE